MNQPIISNDAIVFGLLMTLLGIIFYTANMTSGFWSKFYKIVPALLLCYFLPSVLSMTGLISADVSKLYHMSSRYLLPAALILLTMGVDLKELARLGPKAIIMFFSGTIGIIIGGPIALIVFSYVAPGVVNAPPPDEIWRGLTTIAGSWIGGGANQAAMKEVFNVQGELFSKMVAVDVLLGNLWLAILMIGAGRQSAINKLLKADNTAIERLQVKMEHYHAKTARIPSFNDFIFILALAFGATGLAHLFSDFMAPWVKVHYPELEKYSLTSGFFWMIVAAAAFGVVLSFTKAREFAAAGTSKIGSVFIYILVATIGMQMNVLAVFDNPGLFLLGFLWISLHAGFMLLVARLIKAPFFFVAVGSQANVGGAASAPVVAAYFHPSLAPVGALLAVVGYMAGTYGAYICGLLMQTVAP